MTESELQHAIKQHGGCGEEIDEGVYCTLKYPHDGLCKLIPPALVAEFEQIRGKRVVNYMTSKRTYCPHQVDIAASCEECRLDRVAQDREYQLARILGAVVICFIVLGIVGAVFG